MKTSESIKNISLALSKFHQSVESLDRNSQGYNYKYASLENVLETIKEPLQKSGLVFSQFPDGNYGLTTLLIHPESGEYFSTTSEIVPVKDDPQGRGSALTYNRRYHLVCVLGLTVEDDDGASASGKPVFKSNAVESDDKPWLNQKDKMFDIAVNKLLAKETTIEKITESFRLSKIVRQKLEDAVLTSNEMDNQNEK